MFKLESGHLKVMISFVLFAPLFLASSLIMAASEIDIDTDVSSPASSTASSIATTVQAAPMTTAEAALGTSSAASSVTAESSPVVAAEEPTKVPVKPTVIVGQGVLQMRGVYQAGIDYYKKQDFAKAIRYLKKSLDVSDPYTPKYYYAEANAMLGVIYQFHIIDKDAAYEYYLAALKIDPQTKTAKKHIRELKAEKK